MAVALNASPNAASAIVRCSRKANIELSHNQRHLFPNNCSIRIGFCHPLLSFRPSVKVQAAEQFGHSSKPATYITNVLDNLWDASPVPLKEFPWKEAKDLAIQRLLFLGKKALKWSILLLFATSFYSDIALTIARNRELLIPVGLFIGVALADILKESSLELFSSSIKDQEHTGNLLVIGSFFVAVKFISLCFTRQGWLLLSHISNGGMMQVFWLAKWLWKTDSDENDVEQILDAPTTSN